MWGRRLTRSVNILRTAAAPMGGAGRTRTVRDETARRGNYESGSDYVLEYGELRFAFNEQDFAQRVEQAAVKLNFVNQGLGDDELHDLLELAVNGEIGEPSSPRRAHQRELGGPRRPRQPQPRPLAAPPRLPRRLARPARQGGRARHRLRRGHPDLRLRPARPRLRADRALQGALVVGGRLQQRTDETAGPGGFFSLPITRYHLGVAAKTKPAHPSKEEWQERAVQTLSSGRRFRGAPHRGGRAARRPGLLPLRPADPRPAARGRPQGRHRQRLPGARGARGPRARPPARGRRGRLALRARAARRRAPPPRDLRQLRQGARPSRTRRSRTRSRSSPAASPTWSRPTT